MPLFSKQHLFVANPRVSGFKVSWNGWSGNYYRKRVQCFLIEAKYKVSNDLRKGIFGCPSIAVLREIGN